MLDRKQLILNYGMDIDDCINDDVLSPFELINTIAIRDRLEAEYDDLSSEEQGLLFEYDQKLLTNAWTFYNEASKSMSFQNDMPLRHWWSHLDMVVSGELIVDLCLREVRLKKDNEHAATLTATA